MCTLKKLLYTYIICTKGILISSSLCLDVNVFIRNVQANKAGSEMYFKKM